VFHALPGGDRCSSRKERDSKTEPNYFIYLKKSIGLRAVVAHVKSMLRILESKAAAAATKPQDEDDDEAEFEIKDQPHPDFRVDEKAQAIYYKGIPLKLTASQFIILAKMVQHPRRHFSAEQILDWINPDGTATEQSPYSHSYRLRRVLESVAPGERFIRTHPTNGYSLI
jgi:DNA-binding response OmpR family regulator